MDLRLSLLSPIWWASVLLCTILLSTTTSWLAQRRARRGGADATVPGLGVHRLRCASWVVGLLVLANLSMLGTLAAANLHTPHLMGPVGLSFCLCCLVSLVLAVLVQGLATRA
jgi:hypothetical protein